MLEQIRQRIIDTFGEEVLKKPFGSIVHLPEFEEEFLSVLAKISPVPNVMVKIGTCSGVSTTYFSQWASHISTYDIKNVKIKYKIWELFNLKNISCCSVQSDIIPKLIANEKFDFAFVDGAHDYESVVKDIAMVKRCRRILFHDYYSLEVQKAVNSLIATDGGKLKIETNNFAYWEKI